MVEQLNAGEDREKREWHIIRHKVAQAVRAKLGQEGGPGVIFVRHVAMAKRLATELAGEIGQAVPCVTGEMSVGERKRVADGLRSSAICAAVATSAWYTGVDIPGLRWIVLATGGKAPIGLQQAIGRATRLADGKDGFSVIDVVDDNWREERMGMLAEKGLQPALSPAGARGRRRGGNGRTGGVGGSKGASGSGGRTGAGGSAGQGAMDEAQLGGGIGWLGQLLCIIFGVLYCYHLACGNVPKPPF